VTAVVLRGLKPHHCGHVLAHAHVPNDDQRIPATRREYV
jgi:hypothetical protein